MNVKQGSNKNDHEEAIPRHSKAFDECISTLLDEIELATLWKRPSILLAVHPSTLGQQKAQKTLEDKLADRSKHIVHVAANSVQPGLFDAIDSSIEDDDRVYFVDGLGSDPENYRALNLRREYLVEKRVAVVFWLLETEAVELARLAPDFWAFRHRVIEFAPSRGARHKFVPSGLLNWHPEYFHLEPAVLAEQIAYQETVLSALPSTSEAVLLRAEALELLASHYWLAGEYERAEGSLRQGLKLLAPFDVREQDAKFLNGLAVNAFDQEQYEVAYQELERSLQMDPDAMNLIVNYGIVQYVQGQTARSIQTIEKAAYRFPASAELPYVLGYIHLLAGEIDAARTWFEKTVQLNDEHFAAHCLIAMCYSRAGVPEGATRIVEQLKRKEGYSNVYRSICIEALMGDSVNALEKLRSAVANHKVSPRLVQRDPILHLLFDRATSRPDA